MVHPLGDIWTGVRKHQLAYYVKHLKNMADTANLEIVCSIHSKETILVLFIL